MQSLARVFQATKLSGRSASVGSKYASRSAPKATKARSLASSSLKRANLNSMVTRAYNTPVAPSTTFAAPVQTGHDQLPKVNHSVRPTGSDGFTRVTAHELYIDLREGVQPALIDIRPADEFANWHLIGSVNYPAASGKIEMLQGLSVDRPIYLISGEQAKDFLSASKVAETFKAHGYVVSIIEAGMKSFPDNGFLYYLDADAEDARLAAVAAAKAAAAAAAQKR